MDSRGLLGGAEQWTAGSTGVLDVHADRAGGYDGLDRQRDILGAGAVSAFDVGRDWDGHRGHDLADPPDHLGTGQALAVAAAKGPGDASAGGRDRLSSGHGDNRGAASVPDVRQN